jgi:hypothetical protein
VFKSPNGVIPVRPNTIPRFGGDVVLITLLIAVENQQQKCHWVNRCPSPCVTFRPEKQFFNLDALAPSDTRAICLGLHLFAKDALR